VEVLDLALESFEIGRPLSCGEALTRRVLRDLLRRV
jgi:hypothetical protein